MQRNTIIGTTIALLLIAILVLIAWNQRNQTLFQANLVATAQAQLTAQQNEAKTAQATLAAETEASRATASAEAQAWATVQAEAEKVQATAEQGRAGAETRYQAALGEKLGAQAQLRLDDTADPTLGTLLAAESLKRFQSIEAILPSAVE